MSHAILLSAMPFVYSPALSTVLRIKTFSFHCTAKEISQNMNLNLEESYCYRQIINEIVLFIRSIILLIRVKKLDRIHKYRSCAII